MLKSVAAVLFLSKHSLSEKQKKCKDHFSFIRAAASAADFKGQADLLGRIPKDCDVKTSEDMTAALYWSLYKTEDEKMAMKYLDLG
jgi:hypothetical protein